MAAIEAGEKEDLSQEPSLGDLWEMLVDIQITVNNILLENKRISSEVMELKTTVQQQKAELSAIKEALDLTTKQCANVEKELAAAKDQLARQEEEIAELYDLQDRLEQYTIERIRSSFMESPRVLKMSEALEVPVVPQDIEISHKLNNKGNKAVIVKCISHKVKSNLYRARTNSRIWDMIDDCNIDNLAKNQVSARCFETTRYSQKCVIQIYRFVWDAMLVPIQMGTNMAAGNQQKHLSLSFATKA